MQLSAIDMNLIITLHALLEERSVVRAGRRLALSPSATSHALGRLRELFGDGLLVRAGRHLVPTPRGEALAVSVGRLVAEMEGILRTPAPLEPGALGRAYRVATTDHVQFVLMRRLDAILRREAPAVDLYFVPLPLGSTDALREGRIDVAIGIFDESSPDMNRQPLFDDQLVSVVRAGHVALRGSLTLRRFAELDHVLVAPNGASSGFLDKQLAAMGHVRRVARTVPTFLDAPFLIAHSDYIVLLPARLAQQLLSLLRLHILRTPLPLPSFTLSAVWHRRLEDDPEHAWFRNILSRVAHDLDPLKAVLRHFSTRCSDSTRKHRKNRIG